MKDMDVFSWFIGIFSVGALLLLVGITGSVAVDNAKLDAAKNGFMEYRGSFFLVKRAEIKVEPLLIEKTK